MKRKSKRFLAWLLSAALIVSLLPCMAVQAEQKEILSNSIDVDLGMSMAVKKNGDLYTWGRNDDGQLGVGYQDDEIHITPQKIMENVISVSTGNTAHLLGNSYEKSSRVMAITSDGNLYGWGKNRDKLLSFGEDAPENILTPTKIMDNVIYVDFASHRCLVILSDGNLYGWGSNSYGQLGLGNPNENDEREYFNIPTEITKDVKQIALGNYATFILKKDGTLYECGTERIGSKNEPIHYSLEKIAQNVKCVSAYNETYIYLTNDGRIFAWGTEYVSGIHSEMKGYNSEPSEYKLENAESVFAGDGYYLALTENGDLYSWGHCSIQLGRDSRNSLGDQHNYTPTKIMNDVVSVSTGSSSWLAVKENGQLWSSANGTYQESDSKSYEPIKIMDDIMIPQVVSLDSDTISFPLAPTPTPQPTSLKIYCNEPSLSTTVGNSFLIGAALTDEDGNKGDISKIGFSVSDKNILSSVAVTENDGIAYCSFKAEAVGTADIKISNAATGETAALTFTVNSQTKNAYTVDTVPAASAYGIGCNFSNFNGITIANYKKSPNSDGSVDISFDAYNSNYCYGVVEVYNADGQPFNTKVIDKYKDETSVSGVWDRLTKIAKEALELISGAEKLSDEFWYKSTTVTKETPVSIKVPKGGYIKITSDTRESANCGIINGIDILFQMKAAVDKIGESTKAGTEEKLPEAVITKLQKDINKYESEWAKSCTKSFVTGTIDTADKAANFGEAMQDMLDDGLKDIAVSAMKDAAVGMIEDKITDWFEKSAGPFGAALKQIFTQTSVGNLYEQCTSFNNCANSGAITIHNPSANTRVCSDVTVSCTMSADTALDVYKIDTMSASVRNIKSQNVSEFKDSTYTAAYEINLVENGKLVQPKGKATVTIALPDDLIGYNGEITVYRVEADGSLTKMNGVSNGAAITFETDHFSTYILTASGAEAKLPEAEEGQTVVNGDTIVSEWAAPEVQEAFDENLVPDILHGADLTKKVDRAEFAAIAVTLYENLSKKTAQTGENPFGDISGNYCEDDILKAYNLGITNGITNVTFEPSTLISREQAATMLTRAYKKSEFPSWTLATDGDYPLNYMGVTKYADDDEISDYAKESVYFMTRWDILNGVDNSHFAPKNNTTLGESYGYATREQAVVIALRSAKHL